MGKKSLSMIYKLVKFSFVLQNGKPALKNILNTLKGKPNA